MYTYCLLIGQVGHISFKPIISRLTENEIPLVIQTRKSVSYVFLFGIEKKITC